jgi:uncharacterized protein
MQYDQIINQTADLVENACLNPQNPFGPDIWNNHILEVVKYAELLALHYGAKRDVVILSALLHDYAGILDVKLYAEHHIYGASIAQEVLANLNYPQDRIELVKNAIFTHRGSIIKDVTTLEARCLANADAIAHILKVDSLVYYANHIKGLPLEKSYSFIIDKLNRSWNKMHPSLKNTFRTHFLHAISTLKIAA